MLAILTAAVCMLPAPAEPTVHDALAANYARLSRAFERGDPSAMSAMLLPIFHARANGRVMDKAQTIADFTRQMHMIKHAHWARKVGSILVSGNGAMNMVDGHMTGEIPAPNGKHRTFDFRGRSRDHWQKTRSGWRLLASELLSSELRIDGKVVRMDAPARPPGGAKPPEHHAPA